MRRAVLALTCALCINALQIAVAQDDSARKILVKVEPQYPALAHTARISGTVKVMAHVSANGKVESVDVLGGHPLLAQTAVVAVSHWKWQPASQATEETVIVKFSLD